ncbi:carbonic anhydrase [Desulfovibrio psychrotolerans]|uniref:Carbonic anhydrase n=1 Tax=Desulfovibrio psychrotolerans TaxID=415242 RepID=A0A7J0BRN2_9BACT|nr:carbonic anhydrase [Desulfovibrio psychrotolerans]GFM35842.1 hypothetical protein DSM19430T_05260 [Desulfovibrio psychrotolerans]
MSSISKRNLIILAALFLAVLLFVTTCSDSGNKVQTKDKRTPELSLKLLKEGNERFAKGDAEHPRTDAKRLEQAGKESQGDHAFATVLSCSDSRVPVERIFDAGVMDIFVVRVAGNVVQGNEAGSIEYGLSHVNTPLLVVLGHTQCGAVTAVTEAVEGHGHELERNIPGLVASIVPAVERTKKHTGLSGKALVPQATEQNVWQSITDLFMRSPSTRELVRSGKVKVVGAMYEVETGRVQWLKEDRPLAILKEVEENPARAIEAMAGHSDEDHAAHGHAQEAGHKHDMTEGKAEGDHAADAAAPAGEEAAKEEAATAAGHEAAEAPLTVEQLQELAAKAAEAAKVAADAAETATRAAEEAARATGAAQ